MNWLNCRTGQNGDQSFAAYLGDLRKKKPVVVTEISTSFYKEIDLVCPKDNYNKTSGYTQVEIDGMDLLLMPDLWMLSGTFSGQSAIYILEYEV